MLIKISFSVSEKFESCRDNRIWEGRMLRGIEDPSVGTMRINSSLCIAFNLNHGATRYPIRNMSQCLPEQPPNVFRIKQLSSFC